MNEKRLKDIMDEAWEERQKEKDKRNMEKKREKAECQRNEILKWERIVDEIIDDLPGIIRSSLTYNEASGEPSHINILKVGGSSRCEGRREVAKFKPYKRLWRYLKEQGLTPYIEMFEYCNYPPSGIGCIAVKLPRSRRA
ncbi:MAG: hypothetical protein HYT27_00270 [Parcubacteria group bacterium]|nr:hypothetical protein [Parcubacteria group bacterium]